MALSMPKPRFSPWKFVIGGVLLFTAIILMRWGGTLPIEQSGFIIILLVVLAVIFAAGGTGVYLNKKMQTEVANVIEPMIKQYKRTRDVTQFEKNIDEWFAKGQGPSVCSYMVQAACMALIDNREYEAAKRQLEAFDASQLPLSVRKNYTEYYASAMQTCEDGIRRQQIQVEKSRSARRKHK